MSSSKTVSTPVHTDAACEGTQDDEDRAGASLANLLSVKRREHLVEHDREKQALLSLEALLQEETQPVRERVAKLLEIALPSRMLCDVEQGGALFEDPGLATMFLDPRLTMRNDRHAAVDPTARPRKRAYVLGPTPYMWGRAASSKV